VIELPLRLLVVSFALLSTGAPAQWLHYPTPGLPRTPDGKPNLDAPVPRSSDGHPDLSGIWQLQHTRCPPGDACENDSDAGAREFSDISIHLGRSLPYQPWAADVVKKRTADLGKNDPVALCKPAGALRLLTYPLYRKIIQTPDVTVILSERDVTYRQLFTDGRPLPKDPEPTWNGYSVGKWEGDTLVVETVGFRDGTWLDRRGSPLTEAGKMTERFRRTNFGNLDIDVTIDDANAYTKPWTVRLPQLLVSDTELLDYYCNDNEKDAVHTLGN
jgi:hypothetical protein